MGKTASVALFLVLATALASGCARFESHQTQDLSSGSLAAGGDDSGGLLLKQEFVAPNTFEVSTGSDAVRAMTLYLDGQPAPITRIAAPPFMYRIDTSVLSVGFHVIRAELDISLFGVTSRMDRIIVFSVAPKNSSFIISNVRFSSVTQTAATINWDLSEYGTGQVEYGTAPTLLNLKNTAELTFNYKSHQQQVANLSPGTTYYFRVVSKNPAGTIAVSEVYSFRTMAASDTVPTQPTSGWQVLYSPPTLTQPRSIRIPADAPLVDWPAYGGHCAGKIYHISIPKDQDALITMSGTVSLDKPVWITGGRNVRVVGLDFSFKPQPGCAVGINKVPGGIALRVEQAGTSFIEGLKMDLNGHVADCIVSRNYNLTEQQALAARNVFVQNSACRGAIGTYPGSPYGDYLHADFFQNQGSPNDPINLIVFENISQQTSATGVVLDGKINEAVVVNFEFALDKRFTNDLHVLNPLWLKAGKISFKNVYTEFDANFGTTGNMPMSVRDDMAGVYYSHRSLGAIQFSPEIHKGFPNKPFADWGNIGLSYRSPHP